MVSVPRAGGVAGVHARRTAAGERRPIGGIELQRLLEVRDRRRIVAKVAVDIAAHREGIGRMVQPMRDGLGIVVHCPLELAGARPDRGAHQVGHPVVEIVGDGRVDQFERAGEIPGFEVLFGIFEVVLVRPARRRTQRQHDGKPDQDPPHVPPHAEIYSCPSV